MSSTRFRTIAVCSAAFLLALAVPAFALTWSEQSPSGTPPSGRMAMGNAYDETGDNLILFGGESFGGHNNDVWVLSDATGTGAWSQLAPTGGPPSVRFGNSSVYAPSSNELIVYGGCLGNCSPVTSDVWVLSNANGSGGTPVWSSLSTSGADAREGQDAVYDDASNRMIVFGGQNGFNTYGSNPQVRVLTNADGTDVGTPTWSTVTPSGTPPSNRETSVVTYDAANNRMIVFSGATLACCASVTDIYNDVWVLSNASGADVDTPTWTKLTPVGTPPPERYWANGSYDAATNRLIIFGGLDNKPTATTTLNDVWVLTGANGLGGTPHWYELTPDGDPPVPRWSASSAYSPASNAMVVGMGRNDDPGPPTYVVNLYNDTWVLDDANGVDMSISPESDVNVAGADEPHALTVSTGTGTDEPIHWDVTGANTDSGDSTTGSGLDDDGDACTADPDQACFDYPNTLGDADVGEDTITACLDGNNNQACDPGEPSVSATEDWVSELTLTQDTNVNATGTEHTVTADLDGDVAGVDILFTVTGPNATSDTVATDANGSADFSYTGNAAGTDSIGACADVNDNGSCDGTDLVATSLTKHWASALSLTPASDVNVVGTQHTVTADLDANVSGVDILFTVTGPNATSGSVATNATGTASFTYTGLSTGIDSIGACADIDDNASCDGADLAATPVAKTWYDDYASITSGRIGSVSRPTFTLGGSFRESQPDADPSVPAVGSMTITYKPGAKGSKTCTFTADANSTFDFTTIGGKLTAVVTNLDNSCHSGTDDATIEIVKSGSGYPLGGFAVDDTNNAYDAGTLAAPLVLAKGTTVVVNGATAPNP